MKILLLVSKLSGGGGERVAAELSWHLPADVEPVFVLLEDIKEYTYRGRVVPLWGTSIARWNIVGRVSNAIRRWHHLRKIVANEKADWVVAFSPALCLLSIFAGAPTIGRANNFFSKRTKSLLSKIKVSHAFRKADKVTAISKGVKEDLMENFNVMQDITVIYNPVDVYQVRQRAKEGVHDDVLERFKATGAPIIVTAGRLETAKGQWHLIRSFANLRERQNAKLVLLGGGSLEVYLKELARDLGISEDVYFAGFQENLYAYFAQSDVFVLSSLFEGFGKVIIEAMAAGVPVVSTDCRSGPREVLAPDTNFRKEAKQIEKSKYGVLTPMLDGNWRGAHESLTPEEELLSSAMFQMIENNNMRERYTMLSQKRAKDFQMDQWIHQWLDILEYDKEK